MESKNSRHFVMVQNLMLLMVQLSYGTELQEDVIVVTGQYCTAETFQPRCLSSEVILIRDATYGRMAIGKCISAEEIETLGRQHLGCSTNVVQLLEEECSGKTECEVFVARINDQLKVKPCTAGLSFYLEATYECIRVAGESRSCSVDVSTNPVYLTNPRFCGTDDKPWTLQAPYGQKISVDLVTLGQCTNGSRGLGTIVDGATKRTPIITCANEQETQTTTIYKSSGNTLQIFLDSSSKQEKPISRGTTFFMKLHAVGCIDIIPPEDAYLKRTDDALVIGCYTSRSTWHLECRNGSWTGAFGNCSQFSDLSVVESYETPEVRSCIVAFGGFTLTICLAIVCVGAVCVKVFKFNSRKKLNGEHGVSLASQTPQSMDLRIPFGTNAGLIGNDSRLLASRQHPTYPVSVGEERGCPQELPVGSGWIDVRSAYQYHHAN